MYQNKVLPYFDTKSFLKIYLYRRIKSVLSGNKQPLGLNEKPEEFTK